MSQTTTAASSKQFWLRFDATQNEPDFMGIFMEGGGAINAAATRWHTDFALTDSKTSVATSLSRRNLTEIRIPIPQSQVIGDLDTSGSGPPRVRLRSEMRLNVATSRIGAAINGTLVSSVSGQGSDHLLHLLVPTQNGKGHAQIGLVYASWMAHAASVGLSNMRVVVEEQNKTETPCSVRFVRRAEDVKQKLASASQWLERYAQKAWAVRQQVVYPPSPTLTKAVFREQVGINGRGYSLLHDALVRDAPLSLAALESLFKAALSSALNGDAQALERFTALTEKPGIAAAKQAGDVATATSIAVSHMVAYRADGRNFVSARGADFVEAESWLHQTQRTAIEANDCDGSALLAVGMLRAVRAMTPQEMGDEKYPTLLGVRNALHPYYEVGVAVVGASSAEASSVADDDTKDANSAQHGAVVAGHAIAVMVPTLGMLRALAKATGKRLGQTDQLIMSEEAAGPVEEARFSACFGDEVVETLTPEDKALLMQGWAAARDDAEKITTGLGVLGIEGTTPAQSTLYQPDARLRATAEKVAKNDDAAFAKMSPNVFRSVKKMHVGGGVSGSTHRFYRDIVEVTFARDTFPLYKDEQVRAVAAAATQYVFARETSGDDIRIAGATPKDLHQNEFILVPLIQLNSHVAGELDYASAEALKDVLPPRPHEPMELTDFQSNSCLQSTQSLLDLSQSLAKVLPSETSDAHPVTYQVAYSTLVHNPTAVAHFCKALESVAVAGSVDITDLDDFSRTKTGEPMGKFVTVHACIPV